MENRVLGADISKWNGRGDWAKAKAAGIKFAFIRAGSVDAVTGKPYSDILLDDHTEEAKRNQIPFGFYWYFRPRWSPKMQAEKFLEFADYYRYDLPLVIDVEESGVSPAILSLAIETMWAEMGQPRTLIYTRQSFFDYNTIKSPAFAQMGLWAARWTSGITSPWSDGRYKFRDWTEWKFWQFSADGNARAKEFGFPGHPEGDNDLDLNLYNGTEAQFRQEFGLEPPAPTVEERLDDHETRIRMLEAK